MQYGSKDIAKAAIALALTEGRDDESAKKSEYTASKIRCCAVDFGGELVNSIPKIMERCVVAARREGIIGESHHEEGAVAGAAREALAGIAGKALGLNVGGKIGIARFEDHISVAMFFEIGMLHLNEVAIGLGHRTI